MASGIAVNDKCIQEYQALSRARTHRAVILKINDDMSEVVVDSILPKSQGDHEGDWKDFVKLLPESDCRYVVVDFEWKDQPTVTKSKICLILWSPEYSRVRSKMIYAASQEAVASKMADVQRQLQATELEELEYGVIKNQVAK
ncbi:hypothetical protein BU14_0190s0014 [Porphyra umbilicalis]|uniref:ADF-H domain-containing protein n=1 Tax=Porphyra umbilicalis TaxID=2786 RepID=A0A1X6P6I6_PORUM|nr:hypothetical protein BU14_0190s0014 [Porphyra umbilicalis]|eukprot:OSX76457.1 hypothetical protein BU14_0190s0014 [Porphyra umbilicalis]